VRDRCPSCGGKLTYEPGRDQGFCAIEGIYVEVLVRPPEEGERPPLVREAILHATKRDLQQLCKEYGQRTSGNKTDLLTRILRYMDDHGIDLPPEDVAEGAVAEPTAEGTAEAEGAKPPAAEAAAPHHGPDVDLLLAEIAHLAAQPTPATAEAAPPEGPEEPPQEEPPTKPEPHVVESATAAEPTGEDAPEEQAFLLEAAGMAAPEEPAADELAAAEEVEAEEETLPIEEVAFETEASVAPAVDAARLRRDRIAFYVGTVLVAAGGPGLIFGSVLHDALRVPWVGDAFEAFGPLNVAAALIGGVVLAAGLVAMGVGLRGGIVRTRPAREG